MTFDGTIVIGASLALTGASAQDSDPVARGYQFWLDSANAAGGVVVGGKRYKFALDIKDSGSNRDQSVRLVESLITQTKVNFLLAPWGSGNTDAVAAIADRYKIPMIAPLAASDAVWTRGYKYLFGMLPKGSESEKPVVRQAAELGAKTIAVATTDALFPALSAQGSVDEAKVLGLNLVLNETYPEATKDLGSLITKLKEANADVVVAPADTPDAILLLQQMKERGYFPKMLALAGPPVDAAFAPALGKDAEYVFGATWWTPKLPDSDKLFGTAKQFGDAFSAKYGHTPSHDEVASANSGLVLQLAIEAAGSLDPVAVRDALAKLDVDTSFGRVKFDATGCNVGTTTYVIQIQSGKVVFVYPASVKDAAAIYPAPAWSAR